MCDGQNSELGLIHPKRISFFYHTEDAFQKLSIRGQIVVRRFRNIFAIGIEGKVDGDY